MRKLESWGYPTVKSEDRMIVAGVVLTQCQHVTGGRIYYSQYSALHSKLCWRAV